VNRSFVLPAVGLLALLFVGTGAYMSIEGWPLRDALFMVAITVSTIGYGTPKPLSPAGEWFTIVFILMSAGLATLFISRLAAYLLEDGFIVRWNQARLKRKLMQQHDHYIVVGGGRFGTALTVSLLAQGHHVVVIDPDEVPIPKGAVWLRGDGSDEDRLREAGLERAAGLAAVTGDDATNVYVTLAARGVSATTPVLTRVSRQAGESKALRAGANKVIHPYKVSAATMARSLTHPGTAAFLDRTDEANDELLLSDLAVTKSFALKDVAISGRFGVVVVAVRRADGTLDHPKGDTECAPGDTLVVAGLAKAISDARKALSI